MNLQKAYYEQEFEKAFLRAKGNAFQEFFEKLMGLAYKGDFMACRPWGRQGDKKNDGFLKSERCLFQVYAPNEMKESKARKKIQEDFEGAKKHWGEYFDNWVFVHNAVDGLPPHVQKLLLDFEKNNPGITVQQWGLEELRVIFRKLNIEDLQSWFGFAPTEETAARLGFEDLRVVLEDLTAKPSPVDQTVGDVPPGKLEANALSDSVATLLKSGMVKAKLVEDFLGKWYDASLGERIAQSFREKYASLRDNCTPNQVFADLQAWAAGPSRGTPEHEMAVLAVMAYYFERCDIFEAPRNQPS